MIKMNKKGALTDGFLLLIFVFVIVVMCGIFIYFGSQVYPAIKTSISNLPMEFGDVNKTQVVDDTIGKYSASLTLLDWLSTLMIIGLFMAYLFGCYLVTTKPVFMIPHVIASIILVFVSVYFSNLYETISLNDTLGQTFLSMTTTSWIMAYLPIITTIMVTLGLILTFSNIGGGGQQEQVYYGI